MKYTLTNISTLLPPLQNAIALACWDDAEDLAREISSMCRIKRLKELQGIQEAVAGSHESNRAKTSAGGTSAPKSPPSHFNSEAAYRPRAGVTFDTRFDEKGHSDIWRNGVAKELNALLAYISGFVLDSQPYAEAAISIVSRVAEFEQIQEKP